MFKQVSFPFIDELWDYSIDYNMGVCLICRGNSIVGAVSKSYEKSFAAYHGWATRTAVFASLPALPTRAKLMKKLHENGDYWVYVSWTYTSTYIQHYDNNFLIKVVCCFPEVSMTAKMKSFVDSSAVIVNYIDSLFHSRELGQQLLELIWSLTTCNKLSLYKVVVLFHVSFFYYEIKNNKKIKS